MSERNGHSIYYLTDPDPRGSMGLAGKEEVFVGNTGNFLTAIDPLTGKVAWRRPYPSAGGTGMYGGGGAGLLTTAGKLVFGGDNGGNLVAWDAVTGAPVWHTRIGDVTNPPMTYMLDGRQYILVGGQRHALRLRAVSVGMRRMPSRLAWLVGPIAAVLAAAAAAPAAMPRRRRAAGRAGAARSASTSPTRPPARSR